MSVQSERHTEAPRISPFVLAFFRRVVRRYLRRQFHAVRLNGASRLLSARGPLIIAMNHSSWWDPMICFLLAARLMPRRRHYAPMDAEALQRYGILKRIGVFPVTMETARGALQFLRTGESVLREGGVLWVTPQGRFADVRQRPLELRPGLARLAAAAGACTIVPLAIEYTFWDERLPEALLQAGEPISVSGMDQENLEAHIEDALSRAMDQLRHDAMTRRPSSFERILQTGTAGVGGFYALGERLRALLSRKPYQAEHTATIPLELRNAPSEEQPR